MLILEVDAVGMGVAVVLELESFEGGWCLEEGERKDGNVEL